MKCQIAWVNGTIGLPVTQMGWVVLDGKVDVPKVCWTYVFLVLHALMELLYDCFNKTGTIKQTLLTQHWALQGLKIISKVLLNVIMWNLPMQEYDQLTVYASKINSLSDCAWLACHVGLNWVIILNAYKAIKWKQSYPIQTLIRYWSSSMIVPFSRIMICTRSWTA